MKRRKKAVTGKERLDDAILKGIAEENEMIDDHGPVIIGGREKKPVLPKEEKEDTPNK